jgi:hypothetical protein
MVESKLVELVVAGSSPVGHPIFIDLWGCHMAVCLPIVFEHNREPAFSKPQRKYLFRDRPKEGTARIPRHDYFLVGSLLKATDISSRMNLAKGVTSHKLYFPAYANYSFMSILAIF